jgi:Zn-dependent peptidase ImmA (M78 family)/transcriptional regulator with XRE-family HTH domain
VKTRLKPQCLVWARLRANLSTADLAKKVGVKEDTVLAWEESGQLSMAQIDRIAGATHTPVGYLFLNAPPVEKLPISDLRTVGSIGVSTPSPELLDTLNDAMRRQDWFREYLQSNNAHPLDFVGSLTADQSVVNAASKIRQLISWDFHIRQARNWEESLVKQTEAIEDAGILVMHNSVVGNNNYRPLQVTEFRGFALSDKYAPLVFINYRDTKAAQMFTLAHEVVHIWLGESGVSNLNQTRVGDTQNIERFCNSVAAELLMPLDDLKSQWQSISAYRDSVARLARNFKVSSLVALRRLYDAGYISESDFTRRYSDEVAQFAPAPREDGGGGGGSFYFTLRSRLGKRFISAIVASTLEGSTPFRDAYRLLGVNTADGIQKLASITMEAA